MMSATRAVGWRNVKIMETVKKTKDWIVINKPVGVPSQPDPSGDEDAMTLLSRELRAMGESDQLWLLHRLDRVVGGLLLFPRRREETARLTELLNTDSFAKEYLAVVEGEAPGGELFDYLFKDSSVSKAFLSPRQRRGFKEARLSYAPIAKATYNGRPLTLVRVRLYTGRYHQIRAQLSSRGFPLVGDGKYGSRDKGARTPSLFAFRLEFPYKGRPCAVCALPELEQYPWSLFDRSIYEEQYDR